MAWQRTGLALAAFSAALVHLAGDDVILALPGFVGLAVALGVLVVGERRYAWVVDRVGSGESSLAPRLILLLTAGMVVLSVGSVIFVLGNTA